MMRFKHMVRLLITCLLCLATVGCISAKYVEQNQYLLSIKTLPEKKVGFDKCSLSVEHVTAIAPFDQLDFLYRIKSGQYLTDYYHGFIVAPSEQLNSMLINYLRALGNFDLDSTNESLTTTSNKLQVQITEFYADYRDNTNPRAVISLRFNLTKWKNDKSIVLFDKVLSAKVALKEKNTTSLLSAWNVGLRDILRRGVGALNLVKC
jgi:uncharacterized lipoprotein YmbA